MRSIWKLAVLLLLSFALYGNSIPGQFTLDDHAYIEENPDIRNLDGVARLFTEPVAEGEILRRIIYRPLAGFVQFLIGSVFGFAPAPFHVANIALYASFCWLLLLYLTKLLDEKWAVAAALIFLVHPIHTEAVASAVGSSELLASAFGILSLLLAMRSGAKAVTILGAGSFYLLSLLSKETAIVIPVFALLVSLNRGTLRKSAPLFAAYGAALVIYFALRWHVIGSLLLSPRVQMAYMDNPLFYLPAGERVINALCILAKYLRLLALPVNLSADYSYNSIHLVSSVASAQFVLALLLHGALLYFAIRHWKTHFFAAFSVALFYLGILPSSNLPFRAGTIFAERLLFFPSIGFAILLGWGWRTGTQLRGFPAKATMAALTVVLLCFGAQTVVRNRDWASDLTLFSRVLDYYPDNAKAQYNVALLKYQASQKDEALAGVERALNIYPDNIDARILRARLYVEARQYDQAEKLLLEVRRTRFRTDNLYEMLGEVYVQSGQIDKAVSVYREGLNAFPGSYSLAYNLASVYMSRNDFAMAEPLWRRAIAVRRAPEPHFGLGYILLMRGQFPEAEQEFSLATASVSTGKLAAKFQAYCQIRLSRIDAAKMTLERLLPSGDREVYVMLAYLATIQGSRAAAAQYLHSAGPMDATACNDMSFKDICNEVLMLR